MSFRLRPKALSDLEAIAETIAAEHPSASVRWLETIYQRCRLLGENPDMSQARDDIRPGLRISPVGNYLILYRSSAGQGEIVRVLHGARDLKRIFRDR